MRVLIACKRGNVADRDQSGHCLCVDCKAAINAGRQPHSPEYIRAWKASNPDKVKAYSVRWRAAHPEQRATIERSWKDRHPAKVAEMSARAGQKWAANNKGKRNASVKARQMAKRQAMPAWADKSAIETFYLTAARLTRETGIPHEVDHIIPIQHELVCGLHVPANLQVLPRSVNRSKRNRFEVGLSAF